MIRLQLPIKNKVFTEYSLIQKILMEKNILILRIVKRMAGSI